MTDALSWQGIVPRLVGCATAAEVMPGRGWTLWHAGPPFGADQAVPRPVVNAAVAAAMAEGWVADPDAAVTALSTGAITLAPAQDGGIVTPLASVVAPSMPLLAVTAGEATRWAPVNDGPADGAIRFGVAAVTAQIARLHRMRAFRGAHDMAISAAGGVDMMPLIATALTEGDDLHGSVAALTRALADRLALSDTDDDAYARTPLFALNPMMAAAAAMLTAAGGRSGAPMVTAAGGNGVAFGWKTSAGGGAWRTAPAPAIIGPHMDGHAATPALGAIGDSAVIDALGFGAAMLRRAPALCDALAAFHPEALFTGRASAPFMAGHPDLPEDIRLGLPAASVGRHPGVMLARLGAQGQGLIGRGIAPWPAGDRNTDGWN